MRYHEKASSESFINSLKKKYLDWKWNVIFDAQNTLINTKRP